MKIYSPSKKILHIPITNFYLDDTSHDEGNSEAIVHVSKNFWVGI